MLASFCVNAGPRRAPARPPLANRFRRPRPGAVPLCASRAGGSAGAWRPVDRDPPRGRPHRGRRRARRPGLAGRRRRHLLRDQSRATTRRQVANVALARLRRPLPLRRLRVRRPESGGIRAPSATTTTSPARPTTAGVILDTRNDGRTALMFLANPRGVQYDAVTSDAPARTSRARLLLGLGGADHGDRLDARDPHPVLLAALRRRRPADLGHPALPQLPARLPLPVLHRAPAARRQLLHLHRHKLTGLAGLPAGRPRGGGAVPTASRAARPARRARQPRSRRTTPRRTSASTSSGRPTADTALDATLNPDFSQIESDVAQIAANERFALFFPEKRPFFLEGVDLFATPIRRSTRAPITSPRWGARATGKLGRTAYTALVAEDRGGGVVILPGPQGPASPSRTSPRTSAIGRVRHDLGQSFVSVLGTAREVDGGGHNRVVGPDFQWRPTASDKVTGQFLWSETRTPDRPDLAAEWDGRRLRARRRSLVGAHHAPRRRVRRGHRLRRRLPRRQRLRPPGRLPRGLPRPATRSGPRVPQPGPPVRRRRLRQDRDGGLLFPRLGRGSA